MWLARKVKRLELNGQSISAKETESHILISDLVVLCGRMCKGPIFFLALAFEWREELNLYYVYFHSTEIVGPKSFFFFSSYPNNEHRLQSLFNITARYQTHRSRL